MHDMNIMYRDLKPENIGLHIRDEIKIFDFGLAKELFDTNKNEYGTYNLTGYTGSLLYMAPEVALSKLYNRSADVHPFGILLWLMISLDDPFKTYSMNLIKKLVIGKGHRPPCKESWPKGVSDLMKSCWDPNPDERHSFLKSWRFWRKNGMD